MAAEPKHNPALTDEQKAVLFDKATELPGSGAWLHNTETGDYVCANCGNLLFKSGTKFESTMPGLVGWPAFSELASSKAVTLSPDNSLGTNRTEVTCAKCGSHLGHLFENDPSSSTGKHYCINSAAMDFKKQ